MLYILANSAFKLSLLIPSGQNNNTMEPPIKLQEGDNLPTKNTFLDFIPITVVYEKRTTSQQTKWLG